MFAFKVATILAISAATVFAHPAIHARSGDCSTGTMHCCSSIAPAGSEDAGQLTGILPINLQSLGVPVGANCIPVDISGGGSAGTCSTQTSCCKDIQNNGKFPVGVDCSPFNAGL
ncbi:hypothetical protein ACEPAH_9475 [Sanghuangporus vaninii]